MWKRHMKAVTRTSSEESAAIEKHRQSHSVVFWDYCDVVYQHTIPPCTTINAAYYVGVLEHLRKHITKGFILCALVAPWYVHLIWGLYVCFSSCFSLVKVELPVAGAAKFEMCVVIHFLHAEDRLADLESHFSLFPLEIHFWDGPEAKNAPYSMGRRHPIVNFQ